jgi:hypothetical protein
VCLSSIDVVNTKAPINVLIFDEGLGFMGFGIWGVDHMPIHKRKEKKRKEKKIICAYVQQACLCSENFL